MNGSATYARIRRRELHSPRSVATIVVAILSLAVIAFVGTALVLRLLDQPPLLAAPADLYGYVLALPDLDPAAVAAVGIGMMLLALIPLLLAVLPGRRGRHTLPSDRAVVLVDDEVIASALARTAAYTGQVDPDSARVVVSRRRAEVRLTPASGTPVDEGVVTERIASQLAAFAATPALTGRVQVATHGTVGA